MMMMMMVNIVEKLESLGCFCKILGKMLFVELKVDDDYL